MERIDENEAMQVDPKAGGATNETKKPDEKDETKKIAAPYKTYDATVNTKNVAVLANLENIKDYNSNGVYRETMQCVAKHPFGPGKELQMADGTGASLVTINRPMADDQLPIGYYGQLLQVNLDLLGAVSGACLRGGWTTRVSAGQLVTELTAAHVAYNRLHGTAYSVVYEPNAARFEPKRLKDVPVVGSTAPKKVVVEMARVLAATEYGRPKYMQCVDSGDPSAGGSIATGPTTATAAAAPEVGTTDLKLGAGTWTAAWRELDDISYKFPVGLIGFDAAEFEDSMGSGAPLGVLRAGLGDVTVVQTYQVFGFDKTRRILCACALADAPAVLAKLDEATALARKLHPIDCDGRLVSLVRPAALETVYTELHGMEVRSTGGDGLKKKLEQLSDQLAEAEQAAEAQRQTAKDEMAACAERQKKMAAELKKIGGTAAKAASDLQEMADRAARAEQAAADRHGEAMKQLQEHNQTQARLNWLMSECMQGRNPVKSGMMNGVCGPPVVKELAGPESIGGDGLLSGLEQRASGLGMGSPVPLGAPNKVEGDGLWAASPIAAPGKENNALSGGYGDGADEVQQTCIDGTETIERASGVAEGARAESHPREGAARAPRRVGQAAGAHGRARTAALLFCLTCAAPSRRSGFEWAVQTGCGAAGVHGTGVNSAEPPGCGGAAVGAWVSWLNHSACVSVLPGCSDAEVAEVGVRYIDAEWLIAGGGKGADGGIPL